MLKLRIALGVAFLVATSGMQTVLASPAVACPGTQSLVLDHCDTSGAEIKGRSVVVTDQVDAPPPPTAKTGLRKPDDISDWLRRCPGAFVEDSDHLPAVACTHPRLGTWSNEQACYLKLEPVQANTDQIDVYVDEDGVPHDLTKFDHWHCAKFAYAWLNLWLPKPEPTEATVADEAQAKTLLATMRLQPPGIGLDPPAAEGRTGIVGYPVWLWVTNPGPHTLGPISARAGRVTATARVTRVVWDMGDGHRKSCAAPTKGTAPTDRKYVKRPLNSPSHCDYVYGQPSYGKKGGKYTVTATNYWTIDWASPTQKGTLFANYSSTQRLKVGEIQVLVSG